MSRSYSPKHWIATGLLLSFEAVSLSHCSTPPAPTPPSAAATQADSSTTTATATATTTATATSTATSTATQTVPATANFNPGGADVGSASDQTNATACLSKKTFYDRFASSGTGACTKYALAQVDCNDAGIQGILTTDQKAQYEAAVTGNGPFVGWLIDQCLDCPFGTTVPYCQKTDGTWEVGTKVFYVQEANNELQGQSLCLPVRPGYLPLPDGEGCGGAGTATGTGTGG